MSRNPIAKQTRLVRFWIPSAHLLIVACEGFAAWLGWHWTGNEWVYIAGSILMTATAYYFGERNIPYKAQRAQARAFNQNSQAAGVILVQKQQAVPVVQQAQNRPAVVMGATFPDWPWCSRADLKFFCSRIITGRNKIDINTWTHNSGEGDPRLKIFSKDTFRAIRGRMQSLAYIRKVGAGDNGHFAGFALTDRGRAWCVEVINAVPSPSSREIDIRVNTLVPRVSQGSKPAK